MLAQKDCYIQDASNTIYQLSQEEKIRLQCEAREDYYRRQLTTQRLLTEQTQAIHQLTEESARKDAAIAEKDATIAEKDAAIAEKDAALAALTAELERLKNGQTSLS